MAKSRIAAIYDIKPFNKGKLIVDRFPFFNKVLVVITGMKFLVLKDLSQNILQA